MRDAPIYYSNILSHNPAGKPEPAPPIVPPASHFAINIPFMTLVDPREEIKDVRAIAGSKYNSAIQGMLDYGYKLGILDK